MMMSMKMGAVSALAVLLALGTPALAQTGGGAGGGAGGGNNSDGGAAAGNTGGASQTGRTGNQSGASDTNNTNTSRQPGSCPAGAADCTNRPQTNPQAPTNPQ